MNNLSGTEMRGYKLVERIGEGGFGVVYRAEQPAVGREVAVKAILPEYAEHPEFVERFQAEARTVAKLEHPHIVPLYDYWQDEDGAFLVMRYLKGGSLRERLEAEGAQAPEAIEPVLEQVCEALDAAHEQGVIHRDLKPENVLLDERGQAYLSDFGIAKDFDRGQLTKTGTMIGSAAYVSPEVAKGEKVTPQADIYGLGILLYELLAGKHPFPGLEPVQLVQHQISANLPLVSKQVSDVPSGMDTLVQTATAKIPAHRYKSAGEFYTAYQALIGKLPSEALADRKVGLPGFLETGAEGQPEPAFVGRESELQKLEEHLNKAVVGHGGVVFLIGGAGQGKTALSQTFARQAQESHKGLLVAFGECNAQSGIGDPYLPFREAMEMLGGEVESAWSTGKLSSEGARRLWEAHPSVIQALLENGPDLVDMLIPAVSLQNRAAAVEDAPWAAELSQFLERKAVFQGVTPVKQLDLFEQLTRVLREVAEHNPLLLIFDDVQWADDASISLLFHLARRIADRSILLLCAYRPDEVALGRDGDRHPLEQVVNEIKRAQGDVVLDLGKTQSAEGMDFIQAYLDSEPNQLGEDFRQALFDHTGGHPLFTLELLRAMQERGDLVQEDGVWIEGESLAWDQLPARVEAVIEERIARLEQEIRELLAVASVEGNDFTAQVLARIQKVEERELLHELSQELGKRHRLVREMGEVTAGPQILSKFQFVHHLFQRYLYNGLSAAERRLLHGEIMDVLEDIFEGEEERIAIQLAYHSQRANLQEKAIHYLRLAGDQAKSRYANQDAVRYYSELLNLLSEKNQERFEALKLRASVYDVMAQREQQLADAEEMFEIAKILQNDGLLIDAYLTIAEAYLNSEHALAIDPLHHALELARELDDPIREADVLHHLGWDSWIRGNYDESRDYGERALRYYRQANAQLEVARCLNDLSLALGTLNESSAALKTAQEGVELSREIGDRRSEATGLRRIAIAEEQLGQYEQALSFAEQALLLHREVGDWSEEANALNVIGLMLGRLGRWEESEAAFRESLQIGHDLGSTLAIQFATWNLSTSHYWRLGCYEASIRFVDEQLKWAKAAEDDWLIGVLHSYKGWFLFELGDKEASLAAWEVARALIERLTPNSSLHASVLAWITLLYAEMGDFSTAEEEMGPALEIAMQQTSSGERVLAVVNIAKSALLLGRSQVIEDLQSHIEEQLKNLGFVDRAITEEALNTAAQIRLAQDNPEDALEFSQQLTRMLVEVPVHPAKQDYAYTIAQIYWAFGQDEEAEAYLKIAYDWITLVAEQTENNEWRRGWLEDARRNAEILQVAAERGIA